MNPKTKKVFPIVPYLERCFYMPNGELVQLQPHQSEILSVALTPDTYGKLPYKQFIYSAPKKSGKSLTGAMIGNWFAFSGISESNGEVYCCVSPNTNVKMSDGSSLKISNIVNNKIHGNVKTWDEKSGQFTNRKILNWFKTPRGDRRFLRIETAAGIIELTDDHELLTQYGWIQSGALHVGDSIATSYLSLSDKQKSIVIGSLLGDGSVVHEKNNRRGRGKNAHFRFSNCIQQGGYVAVKVSVLGDHVTVLPIQPSRNLNINGKEYNAQEQLVVYSHSSPIWNDYYDKWYTSGKRKVVPRDLQLDPLSLAIWYMDDGYIVSNPKQHYSRICTNGFLLEDVRFLQSILLRDFSLHASIDHIVDNQYVLRFNAHSSRRLSEIISPYVPPSMRYKLYNRSIFSRKYKLKQCKLSEYNPDIFLREERPGPLFVPITSIKSPKISRNTLYCIEVEDTHNFISGRIITKNCCNDLEQAQGRIFRMLRQSILFNPILRDQCTKVHERIIELKNGTRIEALANDYAGAAGSNPELSLFDELWGACSESSRRLFEEMTPSSARYNSIRVIVTYAGILGESELLEDIYKYCIPDDSGRYRDPRFPNLPVYVRGDTLMYWDHEQRMPWQTQEYLESQRNQPGFRWPAYQRIHENRWVESEEGLDMGDWDGCIDFAKSMRYDHSPQYAEKEWCESIKLENTKNLQLAIGVDASTKKDRAAVTTCFKRDGMIWVGPRMFWEPTKEDPLQFETSIEQYILELQKKFSISVLYYDPWQFERSAQILRQKGIPCWEYTQTQPNTIKMSEYLMDLLRGKKLMIYGDKDLRHEASMCTVKLIPGRGRRIVKDNENKKIDSIISLCMSALACGEVCPDMGDLRGQFLLLGKGHTWNAFK
jgi:phage terminase large subunit-like protein